MTHYTEYAAHIRAAIVDGCALDPEWLEKICYAIQRDALTSAAQRIEDECSHYERNADAKHQRMLHLTGKRVAAFGIRGGVPPYEGKR